METILQFFFVTLKKIENTVRLKSAKDSIGEIYVSGIEIRVPKDLWPEIANDFLCVKLKHV